MLEIRHLVKHFGPLKAVDDISFAVPRGEVLGFLGPNGAGKSTTMKMITGFLAPTAGTAIVCGNDIATRPIAAKRCIGYLPEGAPAYPDMTPADFLDFIAHIRGFAGSEAKHRIARVVEMIRITEVLHQPIETLSKGFKRRVGVAQALLHDPAVLILDEPTDGLDPNQKYEMRKIIAAMQPEKAIIISTHLLEEVEAVCSRAIIIAHGRILADGTPAELAERSRHHNAVRLGVVSGADARVRAELARLPGVAAVEAVSDSEGEALMIFPDGPRPVVANVADLARAHGWEVTGLRVERGRLDDVFREITTQPPGSPLVAAAA
ncbi:MAG TPA: ATP-binding cassette domain-containing protein [Stellaceae bacterium]|nr:ATP-binding cassette domain-containing protein [Stellaceae bacterium]